MIRINGEPNSNLISGVIFQDSDFWFTPIFVGSVPISDLRIQAKLETIPERLFLVFVAFLENIGSLIKSTEIYRKLNFIVLELICCCKYRTGETWIVFMVMRGLKELEGISSVEQTQGKNDEWKPGWLNFVSIHSHITDQKMVSHHARLVFELAVAKPKVEEAFGSRVRSIPAVFRCLVNKFELTERIVEIISS